MSRYKKCPAVGTNTGNANFNSNLRVERLLIQSLILKPSLFEDIGDHVLAIDFADDGYAGLFSALKAQYENNGDVDIYSALEVFRLSAGMTEDSHDDGCLAEIIEMLTSFCPHWHWAFYAKRVFDASYRRLVVAVFEANAADAVDQLLTAEEVATRCKSRVTQLHQVEARAQVRTAHARQEVTR